MRITAVIRLMLLSFFMLAIPATAFAQVAVSITIAPPELPVYEQPLCPGDGYIWTPGYWAYDYDIGDYYWVPGTWVEAPRSVSFGRPPIGVGVVAPSSLTKVIGVRPLASMAGSTTASVTLAMGTKAVAGTRALFLQYDREQRKCDGDS
jgi:hypothetical protein